MALPAILMAALAKHVGQAVAEKVVAQVATDPVVKNEMNAEKPWQSRIAVGASLVLAGELPSVDVLGGAIDTLLVPAVGFVNLFGAHLAPPTPGIVTSYLSAAMVVGGAGYVFYGRFVSGLKPLFSGKG